MALKTCPDCKGELEEGAILDYLYGGVVVERYGKATVPVKQKLAFVAETDFQDIRRVITYRCTQCNRLFPYAQDIVLVKSIYAQNKKGLLYVLIGLIAMFGLIMLISFVGNGFSFD